MKTSAISSIILICAAAVLGGCSPGGGGGPTPVTPAGLQQLSPLVGTWTGKSKAEETQGLAGLAMAVAGDQLVGPCSLTLNANGNGYLKVAKTPEAAVTWRQDGNKIVLTGATASTVAGGARAKPSASKSDTAVATLGSDGRTMTIDMGQVTVSLTKQQAQP
ncbi:MAG TPA: hypothetical protein VKT77_16850 [Chthonomonadaceae bacterium]|nr:hypothetical protein [Chthonomonadaceae bacterium]